MSLAEYLPFYSALTTAEQNILLSSASYRSASQGDLLHAGGLDCLGLLVLCTGRLRAFITSPEGREITLYRLFERDICLFSASCILSSIQFDVFISAEKDSEFWLIPSETYKEIMASSAAAANYTNQLMASRFTEVMWLMEQILWQSFDKRLAQFLLDESEMDGSTALNITHEKIAAHLGTAREVVTRMLKYFQNEGIVNLARGSIELTNIPALLEIVNS